MASRALSRKNIWELSPQPIKNLAGVVLGNIPIGVSLGRKYRRALKFALESQWWSREQSEQYQLDQVRRTCTVAYEKTRYYRELFSSVGFQPQDLKSLDDLRLLPTMDKTTIREHMEDMCTQSGRAGNVDRVSTGGSSGEPLTFYIGADRSAVEYAYLTASWMRAGYKPGDRQAVFRGRIVPPDGSGLRHSHDPLLRQDHYSNFHMTGENIGKYLDHIATLGKCFLHVYPSSVAAIATYCRRSGVTPPSNIRGILSGSESVFPEDRQLCEEIFGVRYFSWYGHSEKIVLAAECEKSENYHVWPTYGHFELHDEQGKVITEPGTRGEIVGTGFINRVVPFIRYRTGDYAVYVADHCDQCGRHHTVFQNVEGRWPGGCLVARDGSSISLTAFNVHDDTFQGTLGYQFYQSEEGQAVLRVVPAGTLNEQQQSKILVNATKRLQGQLDLTLEVRATLERTKRGKQLRVVSRLGHTDGDVS